MGACSNSGVPFMKKLILFEKKKRLELRNKWNIVENKILYSMSKKFSKYPCYLNIQNEFLEILYVDSHYTGNCITVLTIKANKMHYFSTSFW